MEFSNPKSSWTHRVKRRTPLLTVLWLVKLPSMDSDWKVFAFCEDKVDWFVCYATPFTNYITTAIICFRVLFSTQGLIFCTSLYYKAPYKFSECYNCIRLLFTLNFIFATLYWQLFSQRTSIFYLKVCVISMLRLPSASAIVQYFVLWISKQ